jgi:TRAP-type C4-dicarboxylate transport system permease small subunit
MQARWRTWVAWSQRVASAVGGVLFLALFGVFVLQIGARFGLNQPLPWTDELAVVLYLWVIVWASAFMVPEREHVAFDLVFNHVGPRAQAAVRGVGHALMGLLAAVCLPASWDYVRFMAREGTPVLGLPFLWVFLPLCGLLVALVVRSGVGLMHAWRDWRQPSLPTDPQEDAP